MMEDLELLITEELLRRLEEKKRIFTRKAEQYCSRLLKSSLLEPRKYMDSFKRCIGGQLVNPVVSVLWHYWKPHIITRGEPRELLNGLKSVVGYYARRTLLYGWYINKVSSKQLVEAIAKDYLNTLKHYKKS